MARRRLKKKITIDNIFYTYKYRFDVNSEYYLNKRQYKDISETFYNLLVKEMIENGFVFDLPLRLGTFQIVKFKSNKKHIDWKKTNEVKDFKVVHKNSHSDGYAARWWWDSSRWLKYNNLYRIKATRANNRELARQIKENNTILNYKENL